MKQIAGIAALGLALSACSGGDDVSTADADTDSDGSVSVLEAAQAAESAGMVKPKAGQYRADMTMSGLEGLPGGQTEGMKTSVEYCLTQEEADAGFEQMMKEGQPGECTYDRFNIAGGKIDAAMTCKTGEGEAKMEFAGTANETSSDMTVKMVQNVPGVGEIKMNIDAKHQRIGECPE